jgi:hypothetical protein
VLEQDGAHNFARASSAPSTEQHKQANEQTTEPPIAGRNSQLIKRFGPGECAEGAGGGGTGERRDFHFRYIAHTHSVFSTFLYHFQHTCCLWWIRSQSSHTCQLTASTAAAGQLLPAAASPVCRICWGARTASFQSSAHACSCLHCFPLRWQSHVFIPAVLELTVFTSHYPFKRVPSLSLLCQRPALAMASSCSKVELAHAGAVPASVITPVGVWAR